MDIYFHLLLTSLSITQDHKLYNEYEPKKILKAYPLARPHPDPIVETASLAGVTPPDLSYNHHLDEDVRAGRISSAQLETVMYAMMRFRGSEKLPDGSRKGFFLGDGAGVGKGRQIAALIKEFFAAPTSSIDAGAASSSSAATSKPTRVLWVSTSNDLKVSINFPFPH